MGKNKGKLKADTNQSDRLIVEASEDYNKMVPLFSLERLQTGDYCLSKLKKDDKAAFADSIFKRKNVTWNEIQQIDRHGLGYEKIKVAAIKVHYAKVYHRRRTQFISFSFFR